MPDPVSSTHQPELNACYLPESPTSDSVCPSQPEPPPTPTTSETSTSSRAVQQLVDRASQFIASPTRGTKLPARGARESPA
jgi:hypothetical protein